LSVSKIGGNFVELCFLTLACIPLGRQHSGGILER